MSCLSLQKPSRSPRPGARRHGERLRRGASRSRRRRHDPDARLSGRDRFGGRAAQGLRVARTARRRRCVIARPDARYRRAAPARALRCALRTRRPLSGRTGTRLHRQRRALRGFVDGGGAHRRRHPRREEARHRSRARLAFRPHAAPDETRGRQGEERLHDPQSRVPGQLRAVARRDARRARRMARARADRAEEHRILRRVESDESGHRPRRFRHDGQRNLRPRNPHAALRPPDGRRAAKLRRTSFRA